jgi:catechol 2,3-dioxygenase-like lactoylglutathione lyase family enzyme
VRTTATDSIIDLAEKTAALPSVRIAEVVLQTARLDEMKSWYKAILGRPWTVENEPQPETAVTSAQGDGGKQVHASRVRSSFMVLDIDGEATPFGQILALFQLPGIGLEPHNDPGLNHLQFKHRGLAELVDRVAILERGGLRPHRTANHGPVMSFYYRDPDKNVVELCCNNFPNFASWLDFFESEQFKRNPSGKDLDFDEFIRRHVSGASLEDLAAL